VNFAVAWNGREALDILAQRRFDVVLMDCQMPELDGFAATQRLREAERQENRERTPVIALTANALAGDAARCLAAGMDRYLSKPFNLRQLQEMLNDCARPEGASAALASEHAVLDELALAQIRSLHRPGGPDLLAKVVDLYVSSSCRLIEALRAGVVAADSEAVRSAAHALASSSANVGAVGLTDLCRQLEGLARDGHLAVAPALADRAAELHRQVLRTLAAKVATP
jgi:CheY-like chemotaxis protein